MALFVLAAAYMRLGLFIPIDWMDEGQIVYPIWRVAMGEIPYREFQHLYGPSLFFFNGLLFRIFGSDLSVLRYSLLMIKAATCVMVYLAALRISGRTFAAIAYLLCVVMSGLAWVVSTNPYASFYAMALCLAGLLAFLWCERRILLGCAVAGLCFGLAATFKQTAGAFALIALALSLLTHDGNSEARPGKAFAILIRTSRWLVIIVTALVAAVYLYPRNPVWNLTLLLTPVLFLTGHLALRELRREPPPQSQLESFWGMVALAAGFSLPLLGYGLFYVSHGLGAELLFNTATVIPSVVSWFTPLPTPTPTFLLWQLALGGGFAAAVLFRRYSSESLVGFRRFAFGGFLGVSLLSFASLAVTAWGRETTTGGSGVLRTFCSACPSRWFGSRSLRCRKAPPLMLGAARIEKRQTFQLTIQATLPIGAARSFYSPATPPWRCCGSSRLGTSGTSSRFCRAACRCSPTNSNASGGCPTAATEARAIGSSGRAWRSPCSSWRSSSRRYATWCESEDECTPLRSRSPGRQGWWAIRTRTRLPATAGS
jgi:hypothetical protein